MGSAQTLAPKGNQENAAFNNAKSVDDYSSKGMSLQRKAIAMQANSNVMQRKAWIITRQLALGNIPGSKYFLSYSLNREENARDKWSNTIKWLKWVPGLGSSFWSNGSTKSGITDSNDSLSGSSGIGGSSARSSGSSVNSSSSTNAEKYGSERFGDLFEKDDNGNIRLKKGMYGGRNFYLTKKQLDVNTDHLQTHHRHILFDSKQPLLFGKGSPWKSKVNKEWLEEGKHDDSVQANYFAKKTSDNIGFGAGETTEHKGLYSESDLSLYVVRNQITQNPIEDWCLVRAINSVEAQDFGLRPYDLPTHNCQHWVNLVFHKYADITNQLAKIEKKNEYEYEAPRGRRILGRNYGPVGLIPPMD